MRKFSLCGRVGRSSPRHGEDDRAQGPALPRSRQERDTYEPIPLQNSPLAGLPRRGSALPHVPPNEMGQVMAGLYSVHEEASELRYQIAEQVYGGDVQTGVGPKTLLTSLNEIINRIEKKLKDGHGRSLADEYRSEIQRLRRDFNAINKPRIDPETNF